MSNQVEEVGAVAVGALSHRQDNEEARTWTSVVGEHTAPFRAYLFGRPRLLRGQADLTAEQGVRRKATDLLVWFLLNPGRPVAAEALVEELWPEASAAGSLGSFHVGLHQLRRLLEPGLGKRQDSQFIHRHSNKVYSFDPNGQWWMDVHDLERLYLWGHAADQRGDVERAKFCFRRIGMHVARGRLLDGSNARWLEPTRLKHAHISEQALTRLIALEQRTGGPDATLESAYLTLSVDKFNVLATRVVIEDHLSRGERAMARRMLSEYCTCLESELGLPAPQEVLELERAIRGEHQHAPAMTVPAGVTAPEAGLPTVLLQAS